MYGDASVCKLIASYTQMLEMSGRAWG